MHVIIMDLIVLILVILLPTRLIRAAIIKRTDTKFDPMDSIGGRLPFWFIASCDYWDMAATHQLWYLIHHKRDALLCMVRNKSLGTVHSIWHCALVSLIVFIYVDKCRRYGYELGIHHPLRIIPLGISVTLVFR